jgi:putative tricarboxylic transport membrane protein
MIFMLSIVGAYAINTSIADVWWMIAFGVLGYFMKLYGFQVGPVILGVILARLVDENWRRAIISERESLPDFFANLFASPLSVALFTIIVLAVVTQTPLMKLIKRKG